MTPEVVLLLTPFKAPRALPAGVKVFDTTREVSYSHKHLTPLFGVATTPLFLQCSWSERRKRAKTAACTLIVAFVLGKRSTSSAKIAPRYRRSSQKSLRQCTRNVLSTYAQSNCDPLRENQPYAKKKKNFFFRDFVLFIPDL